MKHKTYLKYFILIIILILNTLCPISYADQTNLDNSPNISAESAILIDASTGAVLFQKNSDAKMYPASTTKILTAIIAIEKCNLDDIVTVQNSAIKAVPSGYSSAYLSEGEQLTVNDLLKVFLVHSANDAGYVLAEHVSGSIDNFSNLMNEKAVEIGCKNSHFLNPSGIHDDNHYTTAEDLAKIALYCMKNSTFRSIVSMKSCTINKTNKSDARTYKNTNDLLNSSSKYYIPECVGIKTGYTSEAKNCLISAFTKNKLNLISVVLGAPALESGESTRCIDSAALYKYGYSTYSLQTLATKGDSVKNIEIENATEETKNLELILENDVTLLKNTKNPNDSFEINLKDNISAPILKNDIIGTVTYTSCGLEYTTNLLASHDVEAKINYKNIIILLITFIIISLILTNILKIQRNNKRKSKKKSKYSKSKYYKK